MKKVVCICVIMLMLCTGCSSTGSMEKDDLDLSVAVNKTITKIQKEEWKFASCNQENIGLDTLQEEYGINENQVQEYYVVQAVIPIEVGEIAIFHLIDGQKQFVLDGINKRVETLKQQSEGFSQQVDVIKDYQIGEFGNYLVFVVGVDALSVLQYISSF